MILSLMTAPLVHYYRFRFSFSNLVPIEFDLVVSGGDPLDDLLDYLSEGTKIAGGDNSPSKPPPPSHPASTFTPEPVDYLALLNGIIQSSELEVPPKTNPQQPGSMAALFYLTLST